MRFSAMQLDAVHGSVRENTLLFKIRDGDDAYKPIKEMARVK